MFKWLREWWRGFNPSCDELYERGWQFAATELRAANREGGEVLYNTVFEYLDDLSSNSVDNSAFDRGIQDFLSKVDRKEPK